MTDEVIVNPGFTILGAKYPCGCEWMTDANGIVTEERCEDHPPGTSFAGIRTPETDLQ
jgi:hypothetical protein